MDTVNQCIADSLPDFSVSGHSGLTVNVEKVIPYQYAGQIVWSHDCEAFIQAVKTSYVSYLDDLVGECITNIQFWGARQDSIETEMEPYE